MTYYEFYCIRCAPLASTHLVFLEVAPWTISLLPEMNYAATLQRLAKVARICSALGFGANKFTIDIVGVLLFCRRGYNVGIVWWTVWMNSLGEW